MQPNSNYAHEGIIHVHLQRVDKGKRASHHTNVPSANLPNENKIETIDQNQPHALPGTRYVLSDVGMYGAYPGCAQQYLWWSVP